MSIPCETKSVSDRFHKEIKLICALGRLTQVTDTQGTTTTTTESYTYDNDGNRLTELNTPASNPALYDAQDRLNAFWTGDGHTWSFTYTDDGSLSTRVDNTSGLSEQLTYDGLGNLTQVKLLNGTTVTSTIDYIVDGKGRRIGKKVNGTLKKQWIYDGQLRIVAELTTNGSTNTMTRFVYGSRTNTPELMLKYTSPGATPTAYRIFSDHLGSLRVVVNASNANDVLLKVHYSAFGIPTLEGGTLDAVPMGFAGGLFDSDTGLVRFGARDYDPMIGRWVSKDPILFRGGQSNLYVYVGNDPVNRRDPRGLDGPFVWGSYTRGFAGPFEAEGVLVGGYDSNDGFYGESIVASGIKAGDFAGFYGRTDTCSASGHHQGRIAMLEAGADGVVGGVFFSNDSFGMFTGLSGERFGGGIGYSVDYPQLPPLDTLGVWWQMINNSFP